MDSETETERDVDRVVAAGHSADELSCNSGITISVFYFEKRRRRRAKVCQWTCATEWRRISSSSSNHHHRSFQQVHDHGYIHTRIHVYSPRVVAAVIDEYRSDDGAAVVMRLNGCDYAVNLDRNWNYLRRERKREEGYFIMLYLCNPDRIEI